MSDYLTTLQARAAREFGVPWEVFPTLTPSELAAIADDYRKSWMAQQKLKDARTARIVCAVFQAAGAKVKESDFMPDYDSGEKQQAEVQSTDHMKSKLLLWLAFNKQKKE